MKMKKMWIIIIGIALMITVSATATAIILTNSKIDQGVDKMNKKELGKIDGLTSDGLYAVIETDRGRILLQLHYEDTPLTVCNFVSLAEGTMDAAKGKPFYDGLNFHRVIDNFMIPGGCPDGTGAGGPGYRFPDEIVPRLKHSGPGILSMANAGPGTNGSQFFITHVETSWLDGKHTVFGKVIDGQSVVNAIKQGDKIKKIKIIRMGDKAKAFKTGQAAFNKYLEDAKLKEKKQEAEYAKKMEDLIAVKYLRAKKDTDGVYFFILKEGKGETVKKGQKLKMKYKGSFLESGKVFDDSDMHKPIEFEVGLGKMIPGFDRQALKMKLGEKRTIIIPPELAYGSKGYPGAIPPNSWLIFELELLSVK